MVEFELAMSGTLIGHIVQHRADIGWVTYNSDTQFSVHGGDCIAVLRQLEADSIDSVVTDPPYAVSAPTTPEPVSSRADVNADVDAEMRRRLHRDDPERLTPQASSNGAMLGMQSQNWHAAATHSRGYVDNDPDAFEEWVTQWAAECYRVLKPGGHVVAFGGTPTWHRLARGIERSGFVIRGSMAWIYATGFPKGVNVEAAIAGSKSIGSSSRQSERQEAIDDGLPGGKWSGWGTSLKPAHEPIVLARKPLAGTVAHNVITYGTGALNIDGCRIDPTCIETDTPVRDPRATPDGSRRDNDGRWPTDVFFDERAAAALNEKARGRPVSEFFWHAKPSTRERVVVDGVAHPTVKPLSLMRELVRLVTPPGGTVLDPFAGSGTTVEAALLEGARCVAVEREPAYLPLIEQRIARQLDPVRALQLQGGEADLFDALDEQSERFRV